MCLLRPIDKTDAMIWGIDMDKPAAERKTLCFKLVRKYRANREYPGRYYSYIQMVHCTPGITYHDRHQQDLRFATLDAYDFNGKKVVDNYYQSGFHCYLDLKAAVILLVGHELDRLDDDRHADWQFVLMLVELRDITCVGEQDNTVVAVGRTQHVICELGGLPEGARSMKWDENPLNSLTLEFAKTVSKYKSGELTYETSAGDTDGSDQHTADSARVPPN